MPAVYPGSDPEYLEPHVARRRARTYRCMPKEGRTGYGRNERSDGYAANEQGRRVIDRYEPLFARCAFILFHTDHPSGTQIVPRPRSHWAGNEEQVLITGKRAHTDLERCGTRAGIIRLIFRGHPKESTDHNGTQKEHTDASRCVHRAPKLSEAGARGGDERVRKVVKPVGCGQGNCSTRVFVGTLPPMFCSTGSRSFASPTYFVTPSRFTSSTR